MYTLKDRHQLLFELVLPLQSPPQRQHLPPLQYMLKPLIHSNTHVALRICQNELQLTKGGGGGESKVVEKQKEERDETEVLAKAAQYCI